MDIKKTPYWSLFADVFTFLREHYPVQHNEQYWDMVCADSIAVASKYQGTKQEKLCKDVLKAIMEDLGRQEGE